MLKVLKTSNPDTEAVVIEDTCIKYTQSLLSDDISSMKLLLVNAKGEKVKWWIDNWGCSRGHAAALLEALVDYESSLIPVPNVMTPSVIDDDVMDVIISSLISASEGHVKPPNVPYGAVKQWTSGFTKGKLGSGGFGDVYRGFVKGLGKIDRHEAITSIATDCYFYFVSCRQCSSQAGAGTN
jgi:hypothetical protein